LLEQARERSKKEENETNAKIESLKKKAAKAESEEKARAKVLFL
jgi:hypothetical protein